MTAGHGQPSIGFLTVAEHPGGLYGGYLLLNLLGRPLEFHCTTPVKPSRAQEILYGATLKPYLCGELIGQTLVDKASHKALVVFTDLEPVLAMRLGAGLPVALVQPSERATEVRIDASHEGPHLALAAFHWGSHPLAVDPLFLGDRELVVQRLQGVASGFDLSEPFERIREAIAEAQRGSS